MLSNLSFAQNTFCNQQAIFIQGAFKNIQGVLGKIQGLFKDMMLFQGLFKAHANHVSVHFSLKQGAWFSCYLGSDGLRHLSTIERTAHRR